MIQENNSESVGVLDHIDDQDKKEQYKNQLETIKYKKNLIHFLLECESLELIEDKIGKLCVFLIIRMINSYF